MYPAYPLMTLMASNSLVGIVDLVGCIVAAVFRENLVPTVVVLANAKNVLEGSETFLESIQLEGSDDGSARKGKSGARRRRTNSQASDGSTGGAHPHLNATTSSAGTSTLSTTGSSGVAVPASGEHRTPGTRIGWSSKVQLLLVSIAVTIMVLSGTSRVMSNVNNFGGKETFRQFLTVVCRQSRYFRLSHISLI
jgi:hypothetical protein